MPIHIIREDITKINCDAIVNSTDNYLKGKGSLDKKIHIIAGSKLDNECKEIGYCETGDCIITKGYNLNCSYIIHTVGPKWIDGKHNEAFLLRSCYKKCLQLALKNNCESIAFPIISSGTYGYPKDEAFQVAIEEINDFLICNEMDVYVVVFDQQTTFISKRLFADVTEFIDDNYINQENIYYQRPSMALTKAKHPYEQATLFDHSVEDYKQSYELDEKDIILDESFSEALIRMIDEKNMKDSECYKKANIDRKLFNKIKNNKNYHPKKETALALAISLELNINQTNELIGKAGYILSNSYKFDVIIQYFIKNNIYDIMLINETLYTFDQKLLTN